MLSACPQEEPQAEPCKDPVADFFPLSTNETQVTIAGTKDTGIDGTAVWLQLNTWDEPRPTSKINKNTDWSIEVELAEGDNEFILLQETSQGFCSTVVFGESSIYLDSQPPVFCRALNVPSVVLVGPDVETVAVDVSGDREKGAKVLIDDEVKADGNEVAWTASVDVAVGVNEFSLTCEDQYGNITSAKTFTIEGSTGDPPAAPQADAYDACALLDEADGYKTMVITGSKPANTSLKVDGEVRGSDGFYESETWTFSFDAFRGENCYSLTLEDDLENNSEPTNICVTGGNNNVTTPIITSPSGLGVGARYHLTKAAMVELKGSKGVGTNVVAIHEDGTEEELVALDGETSWVKNYDFGTEGTHRFSVAGRTELYDADNPCGESSLAAAAVTVDIDMTAPTPPFIEYPACLDGAGSGCDLGELFIAPGMDEGPVQFFGSKEADCELFIDGENLVINEETITFYGQTSWSFTATVEIGENAMALTCLDDAGNLSAPLELSYVGEEGLLPPQVSYVGGQSFSWPSVLNPFPLDVAKGAGEKLYIRYDSEIETELVESCYLRPQDSLFCPLTATGLLPASYEQGVCALDYADACVEDNDCVGTGNYCLTALSATTLCHCMVDLPSEDRFELFFHVENEATDEYSAETDAVAVTLDQTPPGPVTCVVAEGVCTDESADWCAQTDVRELNLLCEKEQFANACVRLNDEPACMPVQAYNSNRSFSVQIDLQSGDNNFVFLSQDIAGNISDASDFEIASIAGPEITMHNPINGQVVSETTFTVEAHVDALDSTIAFVEVCTGASLTECVEAECGGEDLNAATCNAEVALDDAINGMPYDLLVRVANGANVQSTELLTLLYLESDLMLSDDSTQLKNDDNALHAKSAKIMMDEAGVLHFVWLDDCMGADDCPFAYFSNSFPSDVFYRRWDASGWSDDMIISDGVTGAEGGMVESVDMAIDGNGDIHFVWTSTTDRVEDGFDSTDKDLYHRILRKNADRPEVNTEDIPLVRTPVVEVGESEQKDDESPALFVDASNNVHLVWRRTLVEVNSGVCSEDPLMDPYDNPDNCTFALDRSIIKYAYFNPNTETWSVSRDLSNGAGTADHPDIVGNDTGTTLYAVWQDNMPGSYVTTSTASPAALIGGTGSGYEYCLQTNLTARDVLSVGTPEAEGLSCDSVLLRLIRLQVDVDNASTDFVPEMEAAPSDAARLYLVSDAITHLNNRYPQLAAGVQGTESGEAMEIIWRATKNDERTAIKPMHRTFNPAGSDNGQYFSAITMLGDATDLAIAQDLAITVDQSTGVIYTVWVDGEDFSNKQVYTASLDVTAAAFDAPQLLMDGAGRNVARPNMAIDPGKTVYYVWDQEEFIGGASSCQFVPNAADPCRYEIRFFAEGAVQAAD